MTVKEKHVAILVEDHYQVLEVWYPLLRLAEEGIRATTIGTGKKDIYGSKEGYPVSATLSIDKANPRDFDAVIIPGGWAPDFLRRYPAVVGFVREMSQSGKVVASICHGGWLLVSAGILKGKNVTSFYAIKDDLIAAGANYRDEEVVVDGRLITSRKPEDLPAFVAAVIQQLKTN